MTTDQILVLILFPPLVWLLLGNEYRTWRDDRKAARRQSHEELLRELRRHRPTRGLM